MSLLISRYQDNVEKASNSSPVVALFYARSTGVCSRNRDTKEARVARLVWFRAAKIP